MDQQTLETILNELDIHDISYFSRRWIKWRKTDVDAIKETYGLLISYGFSKEQISSKAYLLSVKPEQVSASYRLLTSYGISQTKLAQTTNLLAIPSERLKDSYEFIKTFIKENKIENYASLLILKREILERNYAMLKEIGLTEEKVRRDPWLLIISPKRAKKVYAQLIELGFKPEQIIKRPSLLSRNTESLKNKYDVLIKLGIPAEKIAAKPELFTMSYSTIRTNYETSISFLRENYEDRDSGRNIILNQPALLTIPGETVTANVQFLNGLGIDYKKATLLATKPTTKRKKLAWLLRNKFNYANLDEKGKKEAIEQLYDFIRKKPAILVQSLEALASKHIV